MKSELEKNIAEVVRQCFEHEVNVELDRPEEKFGDYSTNVAMQLAGKLQKNPREIAETLIDALKPKLSDKIADIVIAGAGFINFKLSDSALVESLGVEPAKIYQDQVIVTEYSDPNLFKVLHVGHLYTSIFGDAISNLLENAGAQVHRVNFGGDVGLHVAKTMWAILQKIGGEEPNKLEDVPKDQRADWMAENYINGTNAYDDNEQAKQEIINLNKKIYEIHATNDHQSNLAQIYWTCRQWTYDYFDYFYGLIGVKFEKYYPESAVSSLGLETVNKHIGEVYEKSDGAVIFNGEKYGLHTRVFINSQGLPTYEAKDVGLIMQKKADYNFDKSIVITGNEQDQYMQVVLKSLEQYEPKLVEASTHLTHGMVKLAGGTKMSSRKGNILRAADVLESAREASRQVHGKESNQTVLGAVKYALIKYRIGGDIIYDAQESVSLEGNSGPYLQYAHARAKSILAKRPEFNQTFSELLNEELNEQERSLVRKITEYPEVIDLATADLMPHHICSYLYELAQNFNRFYENNQVIDSDREALRLNLVKVYSNVLSGGLKLLGITAPDKM
ncbi:MAG: arginine--tRNA ligase [bacterium]